MTVLTPGAEVTLGRPDERIVDFAEDLGRLLGTAQRKASEWMGQRQAVVQQLEEIRSTADELLRQLTERGRAVAGVGGRKRGRPSASAASGQQPARRGRPPGKKKRTMSAEARERIAAAQRRRWAKVKRERAKT